MRHLLKLVLHLVISERLRRTDIYRMVISNPFKTFLFDNASDTLIQKADHTEEKITSFLPETAR